MRNQPYFSIIIPTYNRADKLQRALRSVEEQTFKDYEVIVCDDGSRDATQDVVQAFAKRIPLKFVTEENWGGPARPRNNGLRMAEGRWVCLLDSDDWWYPLKLEKVKRFTEDADVVHHAADGYTPRGKTIFKVNGRRLKHPYLVDLMVNGNGIVNSCACVRREILNKIGGFSEEKKLIAAEDYDLWLRLSLLSEKFVYMPEALGAYWRDEGNITGFSRAYMERAAFVFDKFKEYLSAQDRFQAETILFYIKGRISGIEGNHKESLTFFKKSVHSRNLQIKARSVVFLALTWVKNFLAMTR